MAMYDLDLPLRSLHANMNTSIPRSTYYDKHYRQSAALIRARRPYLVRNIFTGLGLCGFVIGVCKSLYSLWIRSTLERMY